MEHFNENALQKIVPIGYLRKGDRFTAHGTDNYSLPQVVSGVAGMNGHYVSPDYGFRGENSYYLSSEKNYLNVLFDGVNYEPNTPGTQWPNNTLYERDWWVFYVTQEVKKRVDSDISENNRITAERAKAKKDAELDKILQSDLFSEAIATVNASKKKREILDQIEVLRKQAEAL